MRGISICLATLFGLALLAPPLWGQTAPGQTALAPAATAPQGTAAAPQAATSTPPANPPPGATSTPPATPAPASAMPPASDTGAAAPPPASTNQTLPPKSAAGADKPSGKPGDDSKDPCLADIPSPAVGNPKLSIAIDSNTAWQPRGGTVNFTITSNNAKLDGMNVLVCFGWPAADWIKTKTSLRGHLSLARFDTSSATYNVIVPDLPPSPLLWQNRVAFWTVPLSMMRVIANGGDAATPAVDFQTYIGVTSPLAALLIALAAVFVALLAFYFWGRMRGVPGSGILLWMISTRNGVASLSQAQIMLWSFLIGASAIYVMALSGQLIDITNSTLTLLGITGLATVGSKLQNSQQDAKATNDGDGKTAVPGKVQGIDVLGAPTESEVLLIWTAPSTGGPVQGYIVEYQPVAPGANPVETAWRSDGEVVQRARHRVMGLLPGTSYQFRVIGLNAGGRGDSTGFVSATTGNATPVCPGAPGAPAGLDISGTPGLTQIGLIWSQADGAPDGYLVQRRRHDGTDDWRPGPNATAPRCDVTNLTSGVTYDFRVAAQKAGVRGPWSAVVSGQTLRNPQWADLVVTGDGRGEIDVTRAQMLFFTVVAALFVGMKVITSYVIPEIPAGIVLLMGISNGVYITAKFIPD
jgi:hypothetical protein